MVLQKARIWNYRNFDEITIQFEKFSVLIGPNNIGKTSVLQALEYIFTPMHPRNVVINKTDFHDPSKPIIIEVDISDLDDYDTAAFYHDDGIINIIDNTITIRFVSTWSSIDQGVENECYFVRYDLPDDQQRIVDFNLRYKQYIPYFIVSSERSALQEISISKNRDLGRVLHIFSSDFLKPLQALITEIRNIINKLDDGSDLCVEFPDDIFSRCKILTEDFFCDVHPNFLKQISDIGIVNLETKLQESLQKWQIIEDEVNGFIKNNPQFIFREEFRKILVKIHILYKRIQIQISLYKLQNDILEEKNFQDMVFSFNEIFSDMLPDQKIGINLFSVDDDEIISQASVDLDDQSIIATGSGYQSIFVIGLKLIRILAQLRLSMTTNFQYFLICIEEPENHLHPHMQRHLINYFRNMQKIWSDEGYQLQLIFTSHSPSIVSRFNPNELLLLRKEIGLIIFHKWGEDQIDLLASQIEPEVNKRSKKARQLQLYTEFFMERFADVFFSSCVIIVEGDTELGAIPIWARKLTTPLDFDNLGICIINPGGDNMTYVMKILDSFHIDHVVIYDQGDKHNVENISSGGLFPSKNNEFEDDVLENAELIHIIKAAQEVATSKTNQDRLSWIKGNISECCDVKDIEEVLTKIKESALNQASNKKLKKQVKSWIKNSKTMLLGKAIALNTNSQEIPRYINKMLIDVRDRINIKKSMDQT